jgi:acyl carrier protein
MNNSMNNDVLTEVRDILKDLFDLDPHLVSMETTADDVPRWDSLGHFSLGARLEEVFGIGLGVDDLSEMNSVREIVRTVEAKKGIPA